MRRLPFEVVVFQLGADIDASLANIPDARNEFTISGVPRGFIGRRYQANERLALLARDDRGPLIVFGSSGLDNAMCLDPATGHVVEFIRPPGQAWFVSSSLGQFTRCVRAVMERFPYYSSAATDQDVEAAVRDLAAIIEAIDSDALRPDGYWSAFIDDASIGDLSTEGVIAAVDASQRGGSRDIPAR